MKNVGEILKNHIESNHIKKKDVAEQAGITYNYLSTIFKQNSCDAALLERLYVAAGLHPAIVFDVPDDTTKSYCDNWAKTLIGKASVNIGVNENLREVIAEKEKLIAEKERTIQILAKLAGVDVPGQQRDNNDQ